MGVTNLHQEIYFLIKHGRFSSAEEILKWSVSFRRKMLVILVKDLENQQEQMNKANSKAKRGR